MPSPALTVRAPLLWLLLPLMAGLSAAKAWPVPAFGLAPLLAGAAIAASVALGALCLHRPQLGMTALVLAGGLAGFALLHLRQPALHHWETRAPREVALSFKVTDTFRASPGARSLSGLGIVTAVGEHDEALVGQLIYFSAISRVSVTPRRSAIYLARGVLEPLPRDTADGFTDYLANLGVRHRFIRVQLTQETSPPSWIEGCLDRTRDRFETILWHGLEAHPGTASLYVAMLLGEKAALNPEQEAAFMRSGTFHVFSVSGLHVGVIALAVAMLLRAIRFSPRAAAVVTLVVLWSYVQITGTDTPAVRAYIMIAFLLSSNVFRLPGNALAALAASALVALLHDPLQLFSTGFQMSYSVVAALILMGGPLADRWLVHWQPFALRPRPEWRWWHDALQWFGRKGITALAGCWAAFLASTPSSIGYFDVFSPGSLLANLVILPLTTFAIIAGFLSLVTGIVGLLSLSALFNSAAALIIIATDWLVQAETALPGAYFPATFRAAWLAPAGMALLTAVFLAGAAGRWKSRYGGFWPPVILLALLLACGVTYT